MKRTYKLQPLPGQKTTFGNDAIVEVDEWSAAKTLYSFGQPIARKMADGKIFRICNAEYTKTIGQHILAFCGLNKKAFDALKFADPIMKIDHHAFPIVHIGASEYASLILVGFRAFHGLGLQELHFGGDGDYYAYLVDENADIKAHYHLIATFQNWMKIYDDDRLTQTLEANTINVYRAAEMGCIVQLLNGKDGSKSNREDAELETRRN